MTTGHRGQGKESLAPHLLFGTIEDNDVQPHDPLVDSRKIGNVMKELIGHTVA